MFSYPHRALLGLRRFCTTSSKATNAEIVRAWSLTDDSIDTKSGLEKVSLSIASGIAQVKFNRPAKFNAIDFQMFKELETAFSRISNAKDLVKCVVVHAEGDNFCAGIDVAALGDLITTTGKGENCPGTLRENISNVIGRLQRIMSYPEKLHCPVISVTQGLCIGAGIDFITSCDFLICSKDAKFSVKEIDVAIVADLGSIQRLPRFVGLPRARELCYTGRVFTGQEAVDMRLALECRQDVSEAMSTAMELASTIAGKSPLTIRGVKKALNYSADHSTDDSLDQVLSHNAAHLLSKELENVVKSLTKKK